MPYLTIEDFKSGLDRRRSRFAGVPGSLWDIKNGHITRGGEIEGMKKWVSTYTVAGTFGCFSVNTTLYVFGSAAAGSLSIPSGVTYQRLQHPDGSTAMTKVVDVQAFNGKPYVAAKYADNAVFHFYDGAIIPDFIAGIVRADMVNNNGIAAAMGALFAGDPYFSASVAGNVVTVTGGDNTSWGYSGTTVNGGAINDQTMASSLNQPAIAGTAETQSYSTFNITGGSPATAATGSVTITGGSSGTISNLTINGVAVISSAVSWATSNDATATALAAAINSYTSNPDYTATAVGAVVTITAAQSEGAAPNGFVVTSSVTGDVTTTDANMAGGVSRGISSIKIDGVEVLGAVVNLLTTYSAFASAVASQISTCASTPDYHGGATASTVLITGVPGTGATPNGKLVIITTVGDVTTSSPAAMSGGVTAAGGQPQKINLTIGGTFEVGDKRTETLTKGTRVAIFGADGQPTAPGTVLFTFRTKVYSAHGTIVDFSAAQEPTLWNRDRVQDAVAGMGFINVAVQDEGAQNVTALSVYNGKLAIFSENTIQTWNVSADPSANTFLQVVRGTGTKSRKSVVPFGNSDTIYLDAKTGFRSLKIRDYVDAPYSDDIGTAIDVFTQEYLATLTDTQIEDAVGVMEPLDGRYLLAAGGRIFVFSFFPRSKIAAWSYYEPGLSFTDFAVIGKKLYGRAGDVIYLYGGSAGTTYPGTDETPLSFETPFLAMGKPSTLKKFRAVDIGGVGTWLVKARINLNDETTLHTIGTFSKPTFNSGRMPAGFQTSHAAIVCSCASSGPRVMANMSVIFSETHLPE